MNIFECKEAKLYAARSRHRLLRAAIPNQFSRYFDWLSFNISMVKEYCIDNLAIALYPCCIPKTGKKTEGVGCFWSECAGRAKRVLEICGLAALDLDNNRTMHLLAKQTILTEGINLMELYTNYGGHLSLDSF